MSVCGGGETEGAHAAEREERRVTAEANCVLFLSEVLQAGVKLRVTLARRPRWVPVPVLNACQRVWVS